MKLAAYLSRSRHGVFYFRWPIPNAPVSQQRLRISLQTRCPKRAGLLARHLASCGESLRLQLVGSTMRYDEIRTCVQGMLQESLQRTIARLDTQGPLHNFNAVVEDGTRSLLAAGTEDYWEMVGPEEIERSLQKVTTFSGRSRDEIEASRADVLELYRVGLLAYWDAVKDHRRKLQSVELLPVGGREGSVQGKIPERTGTATNLNATLSDVVNQYIDENWQAGVWVARTRDKQKATLGVLIELLGGSTPISSPP